MPLQNQTYPFHELIDFARKHAGLSHEQLSERARTSAGYTHRICTGTAKPGRDMVIRLGVAMNLSVADLDELLIAAGHLRLLANEHRETVGTAWQQPAA